MSSTGPCEVIEGRRYLEDKGLLDDAGFLYFPTLLVSREIPVAGVLIASIATAPPPRLRDRRIRLVVLLALAVFMVLLSTHIAFSESLSYASRITN